MVRHTRVALLFLALALVYVGAGLLPGRTFAPLDVAFDFDAWKRDPTTRIRVSNSLLSDVVVQFVPWDTEVLRLVAAGDLPWVNRFAGEGGPLFANPQTALFSPFTWPRLMFGLDGWAIMALLKLLAAALCTYWFARELDVPWKQAIVSGLVYATAGYTVVWLLFPITHVFALLPGLAAAALRLMKHPSIHNAALVIVSAALCTAGGHPETLFIGVAGIWAFLAWEAEKRRELGVGALIPSTIGALLGFLLLAFHLTPFLATLSDNYAEVLRPHMPHPFRIWAVLSQVLPGILGTPLRGELDLTALAAADNFNLRAGGYVGAIVLLSLALAWRHLPPPLRRGLIIGIIGLVLSWHPPGLWPLLRNVPLIRVLTLEYAASLFVLFGAVAAGPAVAIVAARKRRKIGVALVGAGLLAILSGVLPAVPGADASLRSIARSGLDELRARGHLRQTPEVYEERLGYYLSAAGTTAARRIAVPGACWLIAGAALLTAMRQRALLFAAAAAAELLAFGVGFNPAVRMTAPPPRPDVIAAVEELDPHRRFMIAAHLEMFPANLSTLYRIRDVVSYDALTTKQRVAELAPAGYDPLLHTIHPILAPDEVRALGRLGVRFVLSRGEVPGARRIAGPPAPAVGVYEIADAVPTELPANDAPAGLIPGLVITLLAIFASATWLRLYTLDAPTMEHAELAQR